MGFSVSGAAAIIFLSLFVAFGMWYTAADNAFHEVIDAQDEQTEHALEKANTEIEITGVAYNETGNDDLNIEVENTGATTLSLDATDLLVDGQFQGGWESDANVDGDETTDLWLPGETLTITIQGYDQPDRVKLVTQSGVATTAEVSG